MPQPRFSQLERRFGLNDQQSLTASRPFRIGDGASIHVTIRETGFLILLNDQMPVGETTCLMPSVVARETAVRAGTCVVPPGGIDVVDVLGPPGRYRLFAIWTRRPLRLQGAKRADLDETPRPLAAGEFACLLQELKARAVLRDDYSILTTEYEVIDRP